MKMTNGSVKSYGEVPGLLWACYGGGFWFRILGYGLGIQDRSKHAALFSERTGLKKCLRLGKWSIKLLKNSDFQRPANVD